MSKRLFGRYRLHERLGVGGWAEVWRATDEQTGETVALKRLHPHVARDASARTRLRREAAAVSVIDGPGVVRVRDLVEEGDEVALILDFVDGEPLSEILARDGSLPRRQAIDVMAQVAEALAAAHAAGIVHRDVKPSNVILAPDGRAHLIDFGIAQAAEVTSQLTGTGSVVGTLRYLAPEVLRGEPATTASDVWALGALAYLLIDGQPPYNGVVPAELVAEAASPPPPPAHAEPELAALLLRSLDPDPGSRPRDAGEFAADLRAIAADAPTAILSIADPTIQMPVVAPPGAKPDAADHPAAGPAAADHPAAEPIAASPRHARWSPWTDRARPTWSAAVSAARAWQRRAWSTPGAPSLRAAIVGGAVIAVVVVAAGLGGDDFAPDPRAAAAAAAPTPSPTISPTPSPEATDPSGEGSGNGGNGKGKGKGGGN